MDVVHPRCAGIDIGKADMKVCVPLPGTDGRRRSEVRTFSTMAAGVLRARDWLAGLGVVLVAMECRVTEQGGSGKNFVDGDQGGALAIGMQVSGHPLLV